MFRIEVTNERTLDCNIPVGYAPPPYAENETARLVNVIRVPYPCIDPNIKESHYLYFWEIRTKE